MKTTYLSIFALACFLTGSTPALAGYCMVTSETDSSYTIASLSDIINFDLNSPDTTCDMAYDDYDLGKTVYTNDYEHFDLGVIFYTPELGGSVERIKITSPIKLNVSDSAVIGNISLETITDPENEVDLARNGMANPYSSAFLFASGMIDSGMIDSVVSRPTALTKSMPGNGNHFTFYGYDKKFVKKYFEEDWENGELFDYGSVVLNARGLEEGVSPFICEDKSAYVYLRNLIIYTNGVSKAQLFAEDCLRDGGNVKVINIQLKSVRTDL